MPSARCWNVTKPSLSANGSLVCGALEDDYPRQLAELAHSAHRSLPQITAITAASRPRWDAILFDHQLGGAPFRCPAVADAQGQGRGAISAGHDDAAARERADLFLAGENRGGINGADKLLAPMASRRSNGLGAPLLPLSRRTRQAGRPFELDAWFSRYECRAGDTGLTVMALPGVFSADGLDLGSQMLLASLPPCRGKLLDFGCGAGVIGSVLVKRNPALTVNMVDINALALESSRRTWRSMA